MDRSLQGLTGTNLSEVRPPTSYLIFKHTHSHIYLRRLLTPSRGLERALERGGPELAGPRARFLRVPGARRVRGNVSSGSGFLRSHPGFGDEVRRMRRQLVMF